MGRLTFSFKWLWCKQVLVRTLKVILLAALLLLVYGIAVKALFWAGVYGDNVSEIRMAVRLGADSKDTDDGRSALMWTIQVSRVRLVRELLHDGADPNDTDPQTGTTVLLEAVDEQKTDIVKLLLSAGADPNRRTTKGYTALRMATEDKNIELQELLKRYGARQ